MDFKERLLHVILFQSTAGVFSVLIGLLVSEKDLYQTSGTLLVGAFIAMVWNAFFNYAFDKTVQDDRATRNFRLRCIHACLFEVGILTLLIPTYAFLLGITLVNSMVLNLSIAGYFLVYAYLFNLVYDKLRKKLRLWSSCKTSAVFPSL